MKDEAMATKRRPPPADVIDVQRQLASRWLRPLGIGSVLIVAVSSFRTNPAPSLQGSGLAVLVALVCFAALTLQAMDVLPRVVRARPPVFAALTASAAALVWLQPAGFGYIGMFMAVCVLALRLDGKASGAMLLLALLAYTASILLSARPSLLNLVNGDFGIVAFYVMGFLGNRLRRGQERAERLLAELEESRDAQAASAALAERARLAREMHDVLAHTLSGLSLQIAGAQLVAAQRGADPQITDALHRAHALTRSGIDEARRTIGLLREEALPGPEQLRALAADLERDLAVPCVFLISGEARELKPEVRLTLYRVAQEAMTNIRKHAHPTRVDIRLDYTPDGICLTIEDVEARTGAPSSVDGAGYGLTGMRERAELLGGNLAAGPTESGFRVELWVPA